MQLYLIKDTFCVFVLILIKNSPKLIHANNMLIRKLPNAVFNRNLDFCLDLKICPHGKTFLSFKKKKTFIFPFLMNMQMLPLHSNVFMILHALTLKFKLSLIITYYLDYCQFFNTVFNRN